MSSRNTKKKKKFELNMDYSLLVIMAFLICFGLVMLYSCSSYDGLIEHNDSMYYLKQQLVKTMMGIGAMLFVAIFVDYHFYAKLATAGYLFSFFLLMLVRFTPLGIGAKGAKRWLDLKVFSFQPSEAMKIAIIIFIPYMICRMGKNVQTLKGSLSVLGAGAAAFLGVYKLTDNLSTGIIVMGIAVGILFVVHKNTKLLIKIGLGGLGVTYALAYLVGSIFSNSDKFRIRRLIAWVNPEKYANGFSFQTIQGLYAIGSGGFFGKGLGNGAQKMIIPEVQNDMILSAICEELGIFGALVVLVLFGMLLYRLLFIAKNAPDIYGSLMVTGIFTHIALQVILNIGVVTNMIPNTGITLPFISFGGTSLIFLLLEMGIALSVSSKIRVRD